MRSHLFILIEVACALGLVGCQQLSLPRVGASASSAQAAGATNQVVIWGEVPAPSSCSCDHPDYLGRVSRGLAEVHLDQDFAEQQVKGSWQLFTVTFDSRTVPTNQVVKIIEDRGGKIVSVSGGTK